MSSCSCAALRNYHWRDDIPVGEGTLRRQQSEEAVQMLIMYYNVFELYAWLITVS
jgi:hypothetical protein